jgi:hypothetical protein
MADKSITEHHLTQDSSNLLTRTKLSKRQLKDDLPMYVEPRSEIESYLLSSADAILDIVREGSVATAAMAAFLGSGVDALKAMEFLIKWPNPTSNQSTYRKQLHFRVGRLDDDAEEADHLLQIKSKGETYPRTEHWVAIVLPKKKDLIRMWVYHTFQRPHFNAEQLDWVVKMDGMESIMEFVVPVAAKNRLKPTNWQWGSANDYSSDPFVGAGEIEMTYDGLLTSKRRCTWCDGKLVPIGSSRLNGARHRDWRTRIMHKKCWVECTSILINSPFCE